jgi:hypothetical protein
MLQAQRIADSYRAATVKDAWYGPSLAELLAQISPELATTPEHPSFSKSHPSQCATYSLWQNDCSVIVGGRNRIF